MVGLSDGVAAAIAANDGRAVPADSDEVSVETAPARESFAGPLEESGWAASGLANVTN